MHYFVWDTFQDTFCTHFRELTPIIYIFVSILVQPLCIGHIIIGLYWAARETGQCQAPAPKAQDKKLKKHQIQPLSVLPPRDVYLNAHQA